MSGTVWVEVPANWVVASGMFTFLHNGGPCFGPVLAIEPDAPAAPPASRCGCDQDPIECNHQAARGQAEAEAGRLRVVVAHYEEAITWATSCLGCAKATTASYAEYVRAERYRTAWWSARIGRAQARAAARDWWDNCLVIGGERDQYKAAVERVRAVHPKETWAVNFGDVCGSCRDSSENPMPWPCPTIAALDQPKDSPHA
jgi:hypothetical protein